MLKAISRQRFIPFGPIDSVMAETLTVLDSDEEVEVELGSLQDFAEHLAEDVYPWSRDKETVLQEIKFIQRKMKQVRKKQLKQQRRISCSSGQLSLLQQPAQPSVSSNCLPIPASWIAAQREVQSQRLLADVKKDEKNDKSAAAAAPGPVKEPPSS